MDGASFKDKAFALLRTNTVLALLCIISIGVLYLVFHKSSRTGSSDTVAPAVAQKDLSPQELPPPETFGSFMYAEGMSLPVVGTCEDAYRVIMIFPAAIDYRADPVSAKYNAAEQCTKGSGYSATIDLQPLHLVPGEKYYVIHADEGSSSGWHDPR